MNEEFFIFEWGAEFPFLIVDGIEYEVVKLCIENNLQWGRVSSWPEWQHSIPQS